MPARWKLAWLATGAPPPSRALFTHAFTTHFPRLLYSVPGMRLTRRLPKQVGDAFDTNVN